jgi:hypothetical protein
MGDLFLEVQEGDADSETADAFHAHLQECSHCDVEFKWYLLGVKALSALEPVQPPPDFLRQLHARLDAAGEPFFARVMRAVSSVAPQAPFPAGVAALGVMAVLAMLLYNGSLSELMATITPPHDLAASSRETTTPSQPIGASTVEHNSSLANSRGKSSSGMTTAASFAPTVADELGADNVTVESPRVEEAVESLKRILPSLQGRLVDVHPLRQGPDPLGRELLVGVRIPQAQYGRLTGELINHGALEAGAGESVSGPRKVDPQGPEVLLYIRFLPNR